MDNYNSYNNYQFQINLWNAANAGDLEGVKTALANGANINWKNSNGLDLLLTPAEIAEHQNHIGIVKYLLSKGASPSGLKNKYSVNEMVPTFTTKEKNQVVEESSILTNQLKVKYETLIQENQKQYDKKQQEWNQYQNEMIQKQNEWIQKEAALRKEILVLEKQRDEARAALVEHEIIIQNMQANKRKESLQENIKLQLEIEQLKLQQNKMHDSSARELRDLLVNISQEVTEAEWKNMSYRFSIPKNKQPDSAFNFFWWLVETKEISSTDLSLLQNLLIQHDRPRLVEQFITPFRLRNAN